MTFYIFSNDTLEDSSITTYTVTRYPDPRMSFTPNIADGVLKSEKELSYGGVVSFPNLEGLNNAIKVESITIEEAENADFSSSESNSFSGTDGKYSYNIFPKYKGRFFKVSAIVKNKYLLYKDNSTELFANGTVILQDSIIYYSPNEIGAATNILTENDAIK